MNRSASPEAAAPGPAGPPYSEAEAAAAPLEAQAEAERIERDVRPLEANDRTAVEGILRSTTVFRDAEIDVALEVLDSYLAHPGQDYTALGAFTPGGELLGYTCYGPTPCTTRTWDLYWIAVAPVTQNAGVGTLLLQEVERRLARKDARLLIVETSSLPVYGPTRAFYARRGYEEVARVPDFYQDGETKVILAKRIQS